MRCLRSLLFLIGGANLVVGELCAGPRGIPAAQSVLANTIFINLIPQDSVYFEVDIGSTTIANISYEEWERAPVNNSIFPASAFGTITITNKSPIYPSILNPCAQSITLAWPAPRADPSFGGSWGACGFQNGKSNIVAMVPAQASSTSATFPCTWTAVQLSPNFTVPNATLRISTASFLTPLNTTYQTPIAFQMYCTVIDTGVASWTATPIDGLQQQIPSATCADTEQGCYHTSSFWDEANYTQLLTVGIDDPAGSGSKVTCTQIRAVDLSTPNNVSIGAFTMIPWISAMGGATMLLAVYGNQSSTDSEYNYLQMRNYWTFGDLCSGSESAKIQLIPPPPPPPQSIPEQIGWSLAYIAMFAVLAGIVGLSFRGCKSRTAGTKAFSPMINSVESD
eukprot:m.128231 g.128231  ORF g.128231 m.128231 type:complete len:394 (-) comp22283_c0_seq1:95-1276(-)